MSATDRAYDFAKQRILDGRLAGGELITEGDIADGTGLSRTPVREAFLRLESEGLLRLYPKRGAMVTPVSLEEVENVMETRLLVERHVITKAIREGTVIADALQEALARQQELASVDRSAEFVEADREFHRLFVAAARNSILLLLYDSLRDRQSRMGLVAIARDEQRIEEILAEHRELVDAVLEADADRASEIIGSHLAGTLAVLLSPSIGDVRVRP